MDNIKIIKDFINFKLNENIADNEINENTALHYHRILEPLSKSLKQKSFKKATESDILSYLSHYSSTTKNVRIPMLKAFYRWLYNLDEDDKLPDCIRRIKKSKKASNKDDIEYREKTITEIEYDKIIEFTPKLVQKAITETFHNFGIRLSELHSMKSQDVQYDKGITKITVRKSKTKTRDVIFEGRSEHLLKYHETYYPYKDQKNKPLWIFGTQHKPYTKSGIERFIGRNSINAIHRHITPHDFRHTAITRARANNVPPTFIETNFGFTKDSTMMNIYDHNKIKDYEEWLRQRNKEIEPSYTIQKRLYEESTIKQQEQIAQLKKQFNTLQNGFDVYNEFINEFIIKPLDKGTDLKNIDVPNHTFNTSIKLVNEPELKEAIRQKKVKYNLEKDFPKKKQNQVKF